MENGTNKLPRIADLHDDVQVAFRNDELNLLLNQPPKETWLKVHPFIKGEHKYIPIERIELLLTQIFQVWEVTVNSFGPLFNSVAVHVTLKVRNPLNGEWITQDGVGAMPVQTDSGAAASDMKAIKSDAIMKALPAAESYAIKDAAEKLGKLFGKDLNRKDDLAFIPAYAKNGNAGPITREDLQELFELKKDSLNELERESALRILNNNEENSYSKLHKTLKEK